MTSAEAKDLIDAGEAALANQQWGKAIELAKQVLADPQIHPAAARIAAMAACQLGHAAEAQRYFIRIPPRNLKMRKQAQSACRAKGVVVE